MLAQADARAEARGRRTAHPDDARSRLVSLTKKGREACAPAIAEAVGVNELAFADLDDAERERFVELMGRVVASLKVSLRDG